MTGICRALWIQQLETWATLSYCKCYHSIFQTERCCTSILLNCNLDLCVSNRGKKHWIPIVRKEKFLYVNVWFGKQLIHKSHAYGLFPLTKLVIVHHAWSHSWNNVQNHIKQSRTCWTTPIHNWTAPKLVITVRTILQLQLIPRYMDPKYSASSLYLWGEGFCLLPRILCPLWTTWRF
jgi:hypothetical protein